MSNELPNGGQPPNESKAPTQTEQRAPPEENIGNDAVCVSPLPKLSPHTEPAPSDAANPAESSQKKKHDFKWWKERLEVGAIIFGFIFGMAGFAVLVWQTRITQRTLVISQEQMKITQEQIVLDKRAWIGSGTAALMLPYSSEHVGIKIEVENTGSTPATIESIDIEVGMSKAALTNITHVMYESHLGGMIMSPNQKCPLLINKRQPIEASDFALLLEGKQEAHFHVKIRYSDIFSKVRRSDFCVIVSGKPENMSEGGMFRTCGFGRMD